MADANEPNPQTEGSTPSQPDVAASPAEATSPPPTTSAPAPAPAPATYTQEQMTAALENFRGEVIKSLTPHFDGLARREKEMQEHLLRAFGLKKDEPRTVETVERDLGARLAEMEKQLRIRDEMATQAQVASEIEKELAPAREELKSAFAYPGFQEHVYRVMAQEASQNKIRNASEVARDEAKKLYAARDAELTGLGVTLPTPAADQGKPQAPSVLKPGARGASGSPAAKAGASISEIVDRYFH